MAIFWPKPWVKPFWKNVNFSTFWTSCFYSRERRFLALEYRKTHFPGLYYLKKNIWKWALFWPKPCVNPFETMSIFFTFSTSCFYSLERRFFVLEYRKRHFTRLYCIKKIWKNGHFWTKTMGYPLMKSVNFSRFWTCRFYSPERRFFVLEFRKRYFPGLHCLK